MLHETKQRFLEGQLHPVNLLMCPYQCVTNLPVPRAHPCESLSHDLSHDGLMFDGVPAAVSAAAQMMGDLVTGRVAESTGRGSTGGFDEADGASSYDFVSEVLRWRAQSHPDNQLYTLLDAKVIPTHVHRVSLPCLIRVTCFAVSTVDSCTRGRRGWLPTLWRS